MKKLLAVLLVVVGILFSQLTIVNTNAYADANQCSQSTFMGLRPWYYGISAICDGEQPKDQYEIRRIIWQIVLNVVTMVLQIAGYVCVGYVIWGGYLYMLSNGDPGKVASGKKTIMRALIGIVICVTASSASPRRMASKKSATGSGLKAQDPPPRTRGCVSPRSAARKGRPARCRIPYTISLAV